MAEVIKLDDDQRSRAESILGRLSDKEVSTPEDILTEWETPETDVDWDAHHDGSSSTHYEYVISPTSRGRSQRRFTV